MPRSRAVNEKRERVHWLLGPLVLGFFPTVHGGGAVGKGQKSESCAGRRALWGRQTPDGSVNEHSMVKTYGNLAYISGLKFTKGMKSKNKRVLPRQQRQC